MPAIWKSDGDRWTLLPPAKFSDEATLHTLVEDAPNILPLAGSPQLTVLGREVTLGSGSADLVAVESSGRLCVIEAKLAKNPEARRAVVAQVLTYAAHLRRVDPAALEEVALRKHLHQRGFDSIEDAVRADDQDGSLDPSVFRDGLAQSLGSGKFRLVIVLDDAPPELTTLVGYLESMTPDLQIDLITVSAYDIDGTQVIVPQRVDPERLESELSTAAGSPAPRNRYEPGAEEFKKALDFLPEDRRPTFNRIVDWAERLESGGLTRLSSTITPKEDQWVLRPLVPGFDSGLITIWEEKDVYISIYRSAFEKHAPDSLPAIETLLNLEIGHGNTVYEITDELLDLLATVYREASGVKP